MNYLSITGRRIDYGAAIGYDSHMAAYYYNISCPQVIETADPLILSYTPPTGGSQVTLANANLIQAPVYKTGTVKGIGALGSPHIGAS